MSLTIQNDSKKEIKLTLQISKTVNVDSNSSIRDVKRIVVTEFGVFSNELNLFIKDCEVTTLENMNLLRTLDYYKTNTLLAKAKSFKRDNFFRQKENPPNSSFIGGHLNNDNSLIMNRSMVSDNSELNSNYNNTKDFQRSLNNKLNDAYKNLNHLKNTINHLNKTSHRLIENTSGYLHNNDNISSQNLRNRQNVNESVNSEYDHRKNLNYSGFGIRHKSEDVLPVKHSMNNNNFNEVDNLNLNYSGNIKNEIEVFPKSDSRFASPIFREKNYKDDKFFNSRNIQNTNPGITTTDEVLSRKPSGILKNKYTAEEDTRMLREENENIFLTNQILNKSNLELKNQLRSLESELEINRELRSKINELYSMIENFQKEISNCEMRNNELAYHNDNLQIKNSEIINENKILKNQIENINKNLSMHEKTNFELKSGIETFEDILRNYENEKSLLTLHLSEKEKNIEELNNKIFLNEEFNDNIKKNIHDYEDMLNNMKRTIEILKTTSVECENEVMKLKITIEEKDSNLELKMKEIADRDRQITSLTDELNLAKNEMNYYNMEIIEKNKSMDVYNKNIRTTQLDIDKYKLKIDNLHKVIEEKDNTIENMKSGYNLLNETLEHFKNENDNFKKKIGGELIERNRLNKNKELIENLNLEINKKSEEFMKYRETIQKTIINLENEINEYRQKLNGCQYEFAKVERDAEEREDINENLNSKISLLSKEREKSDNLIQNLTTSNDELVKELEVAKSTLNNYNIEIKNLKLQLDKKDETFTEIVRAKVENENQIFKLQDKIKKTEIDLLNASDKYMKAINESSILEITVKSENIKLIEDNRKKEKSIQEYLEKILTLEEMIRSNKDTKQKSKSTYENTINEMRKNLQFSNEKEISLSKEINRVNDMIVQKENELKIYINRNVDLDKNIEDLLNSNEILIKENKTIAEKYLIVENRVISLEEKLNIAKQQNEDHSNLTDEIGKKYQDLVKINNKMIAENMLLKEKFEKLNADYLVLLKEPRVNSRITKYEKENEDDDIDIDPNINTNVKVTRRVVKIKPKDDKLNKNVVTHTVSRKIVNNYNEEDDIKINVNKNFLSKLKDSYIAQTLVKKPTDKVGIKEGSKFLFRVYDSKRILRFDLENRNFQIIEFADYGYFDNNFEAEGSIYLNVVDGLFIITGENHDLLYHFSYSQCTMKKLSKLNDNHSNGSLILDEKNKNLICLSGWHNRKVEKYNNNELLTAYLPTLEDEDYQNDNNYNIWTYLPEMTSERSECSCIIINNRILYTFFGYCCPKMKYLETIEYLDLDMPSKWDILKFSNFKHLTTSIKSHSLLKISDKDILLLGGFDGHKETPIENFLSFDFERCCLDIIDRKLPDIIFNHCYYFQKDSTFVPFLDVCDRLHYAAIDEKDNAHIIEVNSLQYDVIKFD